MARAEEVVLRRQDSEIHQHREKAQGRSQEGNTNQTPPHSRSARLGQTGVKCPNDVEHCKPEDTAGSM